MAHEVEENDFNATVREPLPEYPDPWRVVCEKHPVTSPDFVRAADDLFQGVADRHSAEYDGWEASL
jgi:Regulator of ribonuclease activity B